MRSCWSNACLFTLYSTCTVHILHFRFSFSPHAFCTSCSLKLTITKSSKMARLNLKVFASDIITPASAVGGAAADYNENDEDDELPDLCTLLQRLRHTENDDTISSEAQKSETEVVSPKRKQRPLKLAHVNSLLLLPVGRREKAAAAAAEATPGGGGGLGRETNNKRRGGMEEKAVAGRIRERIKKEIPSRISISDSSSSSSSSSELEENSTEDSSDGLSDFIVDDSASELDEVELPRIRIPKDWKRKSAWKNGRAGEGGICPIPDGTLADWNEASPTKSILGRSVGGAGNFLKEPGAGLKMYESYLYLPVS